MNKKNIIIIIATILVIFISLTIILINVTKNKKYTGSMYGTYIYQDSDYKLKVVLNNDGSCINQAEGSNSFLNVYTTNCTYVRQDNKIILTYTVLNTGNSASEEYEILPNGNLHYTFYELYRQ